MMMPMRNDNKITAYCYGSGNLSRPNGCSSTSMRKSMASTKKNIVNRSTAIGGFEAGIGIDWFLKGKSFFITGATGFLSKVLIDKILRTAPDVDKIYVLIKAKNKEATFDRLKNEIINIELFRSLQETHGNEFHDFMLKKLIPVTGNMIKAKMGIDAAMAKEISQEVDIIVHSAANTIFDERYDVALHINTIGTFRLMRFAKTFTRLKVFLHVSTAYVNGKKRREGTRKALFHGG